MRVFLFKEYDKFGEGRVHVFDRHIGLALCRNNNAFGFPADEAAFRDCEKSKLARKDQLKVWARGVGIPTSEKTADELRELLLDLARAA